MIQKYKVVVFTQSKQDVHLKAKGYRICSVRNYYLFYIVEGDTVQIHRILYNKMDFTKLF